MNMYTGMTVAILTLAIFMNGHLKGNKRYTWLICFLMFCVLGLRDAFSIGIDAASSYIRIFNECGTADWAELAVGREQHIGFAYLMKLVYILGNGDYQLFIVLQTAFCMLVFAYIIGKYSCNPLQSFIYYLGLWFFLHQFNILKQCFAMAFVLLAFDQIMERKPFRFLILVLIGSTFHFPALVFLPAYWIATRKAGLSYVFTLGGMLLATYYFRDTLLEFMLDLYDTTIYDSDMRFLGNKVIIMLGIVLAALVLRPPVQEFSLYNALLQLMGIAIVLQTFASYNNTFERLADYYFQFSVIFIPMVFQKCGRKSLFISPSLAHLGQTLGPWVFCGFGIWRFLNAIQSSSWAYLPYQFFFQV